MAASLPGLRSFEGRLAEGPAVLLQARASIEALEQRLWRLAVYSGMDSAVDTTNQAATERDGRVQGLFGQFMGAIAYVEPRSCWPSACPPCSSGWPKSRGWRSTPLLRRPLPPPGSRALG